MAAKARVSGATAEPAPIDEALDQLGLTSTERRAYRFLLENGASTPTQIADATGQSRGRIYETLRLLVERGLAREEPSRPIRYLHVPPADVVAVALADAQRRGYALREAYAGLARVAKAPAAMHPFVKASDIVVLSGRPAVHAEMKRLISRARELVLLEGRPSFARRLEKSPDLVAALKDARRRGARVEVHTGAELDVDVRTLLETRIGAGAMRSSPSPPVLVTLITESAALVVAPQPDDDDPAKGDDLGHRTEGPAIAATLRARFVSHAASGQEAETVASGPAAFAGAVRTVDVLGSTAWGQDLRLPAATLQQALIQAHRRGVALRFLLLANARGDDPSSDLRAVADVRVAEWIPARFALVDGRVHHFGEGDGATRSTSDPQEVRFYRDLFERLWSQAGASRPA